MKRTLLLIIICITMSCRLMAQKNERLIRGVITDESTGRALVGAHIYIKGTNNGVVTEVGGAYRLNVKLGDIVVISYVGMKTREVLITNQNSLSPGMNRGLINYRLTKYYDNSRFVWDVDTVNIKPAQKGVATFTDSSATYRLTNNRSGGGFGIYKLKFDQTKNNNKGEFWVKNVYVRRYGDRYKWQVKWQQAFELETANRLPDLQNQYAQGRPVNGQLTWQGAETSEEFSWGPAIEQLSFDQSAYLYDKNGALTTTNGTNKAKAYNPLSFFRTGNHYTNEVEVTKHFYRDKYLRFLVNNQWSRGIIPGNETRSNYLMASYAQSDFYYTRLGFSANVAYLNQQNTLPGIGANFQNIVRNVFATPPTFDNANGLDWKQALKTPATYALPDGSKRSFSATFADNPYGVVQQIPDNNVLDHLSANVRLRHKGNYMPWAFTHQLGYQKSSKSYTTGVPGIHTSTSDGRLVKRTFRQSGFFVITEARKPKGEIRIRDEKISWEARLQQSFRYEKEQVHRLNATAFSNAHSTNLNLAGNIASQHTIQQRATYSLRPQVTLGNWWHLFMLKFASPLYFSSTLDSKQQRWFLPELRAKLSLSRLFGSYKKDIYLMGVFSKSLNEAPLIYNRRGYNSTQTSLGAFQQYYEDAELPFSPEALPETKNYSELLLSFEVRKKLHLAVVLRHEQVKNLLVPEYVNQQFVWGNVGEKTNTGLSLRLLYTLKRREHFLWQTNLEWISNRPKITQLYNNRNRVALAGYQEVSQQLIAGQPYGVLYGTRFARNNQGQVLIGNDGFPVVATEGGIVGNPNPVWEIQWQHLLQWKRLKLDLRLHYQHGGDRWNGTRAMLNYLGVSAQSAQSRNIRSYVFDGVSAAGTPNQTEVDFANPAHDIAQNRWVRYGLAGVAEEHIEDASSLRIENIRLTYDFGLLFTKMFKASVFARNLLLYAPYGGVDPVTRLLGYGQANGMDLFNTPATASYGIELRIIF